MGRKKIILLQKAMREYDRAEGRLADTLNRLFPAGTKVQHRLTLSIGTVIGQSPLYPYCLLVDGIFGHNSASHYDIVGDEDAAE